MKLSGVNVSVVTMGLVVSNVGYAVLAGMPIETAITPSFFQVVAVLVLVIVSWVQSSLEDRS